MHFEFPITLIGEAALSALAPGAEGRVIAVFRRSFYTEFGAERLACLGPSSLGEGPLNALCVLPEGLDWKASGLRPGSPAHRTGSRLVVGGRYDFALASACRWRPAPPPPAWSARDLAIGLRLLAETARGGNPLEGLAPLVPALCMTQPLGPGPGGNAEPLLKAAAPAVEALRRWLLDALSGGAAEMPAAVRTLIGLGPGLTPSGDDCLGGAMVALSVLGRPATAARLADWALPLARAGTGKISLAHLRCAAAGQGAGGVMEMLSVLLAAGVPDLAGRLAVVAAIGHSSGWDALAGVVAACAAFCAASGERACDG